MEAGEEWVVWLRSLERLFEPAQIRVDRDLCDALSSRLALGEGHADVLRIRCRRWKRGRTWRTLT